MATTFGGRSCVDPEFFAASCREAGLSVDRWWGKAGAFRTGLGRAPGRGWFLLRGADLDAIDPTADHELRFIDGDRVRTLRRITLLNAECIAPGAPGDPNAVYLCELVDRRHFLGRVPLDRAYNLRVPDGTSYFSGTLNGGSSWTWQEVVTDLATVLGIAPLALPFTPDGVPESLAFWAPYSAWDALCDVLDRLACAIDCDPTADTFTVVRLGEPDQTATATNSALWGQRLWDGYSSEAVRGWRPEAVRVIFPRLPIPTPPGSSSPVYTVDVPLPAIPGVAVGTVVQLWDDEIAQGSTGTPANAAALATRAAERASDWLRKRGNYERPLLRSYRDFQSPASLLGSLIGDLTLDDRGSPFATVVRAGPDGLLEKWRPTVQTPWPLTGVTLTVEEVDGDPSVPGTTILQFDQDDGFVVSQPSAGVARIDLDYQTVETNIFGSMPSYGFQQIEVSPGIYNVRLNLADPFAIVLNQLALKFAGGLALNGLGQLVVNVGAIGDLCKQVGCCLIEYGVLPGLDFEVTPEVDHGDYPFDYEPSVTISGGIGSFTLHIDWDDGSSPEESTTDGPTVGASHTYEAPGVYEVVVTVTDWCGDSVSKIVYVVVGDPACAACINCLDSGFPRYFQFVLSGATGDFADLNGVWTVYHGEACHYYGFNANGWRVTGGLSALPHSLNLQFDGPGGAQVIYGSHVPDIVTCCTGGEMDLLSSFGTGDTPVFNSPGVVNSEDCTPCKVQPDCTDYEVNKVLYLTISGADACLNGTYSATYDGTQWKWEYAGACGTTGERFFNLFCQDGALTAGKDAAPFCAGFISVPLSIVSTSPFLATFSFTVSSPCGSGTATGTISDSP